MAIANLQQADAHTPSQTASIREDRIDIPSDPTAIFDAIADSDVVCRTCFSRLRRYEQLDNRIGERIGRDAFYVEYDLPPHEPRWNIHDRAYFESVREPNRMAHLHSSSGRHTYCANCGTVNTEITPNTRSKRNAIEAAIGLSVTLDEYDVEHDWLLLVELVKQLKSKPNWAGRDMDIFRKAVSAAIEHSR